MQELKILSFDNNELHLYIWDQVSKPKGVMQLVHGSSEYAFRYDEFAKYLNANGWIVIGNDLRGHGKTVTDKDHLGFLSVKDGWDKLVLDLKVVNDYIVHNYPKLGITMLGRSMGSFLVRHYVTLYSYTIESLVICATTWKSKMQLWTGKFIAKYLQKRQPLHAPSNFINNLTYKKFSKKIKEKDNDLAWLTRDKNIQEKFRKDPLTGQIFTASAFKDMFTGLLYIMKKKNIIKTRKTLPIFFIGGMSDPVSNFGKDVEKTARKYRQYDFKKTSILLYSGMRHEILNEIGKEQVYQDILNFINKYNSK